MNLWINFGRINRHLESSYRWVLYAFSLIPVSFMSLSSTLSLEVHFHFTSYIYSQILHVSDVIVNRVFTSITLSNWFLVIIFLWCLLPHRVLDFLCRQNQLIFSSWSLFFHFVWVQREQIMAMILHPDILLMLSSVPDTGSVYVA